MQSRKSVFQTQIDAIGTFSFVAYDNKGDAEVIHPWVNMEYAKFWMLNDSTLEDVRAEYKKIMAPKGTTVYMGYLNKKPVFLTEIYDPTEEELSKHVKINNGDFGMHVLVGPAEKKISNFTQSVFKSIMLMLFEYHGAKRVVVEPDVSNHKIHLLNEKAGFKTLKNNVHMSNKFARIEMCEKKDFYQSVLLQ